MTKVLKKNKTAEEIAQELADIFAKTAVERDATGGTAKTERDLIRQSGLLKLLIPVEYGGLGGNWLDVLNVIKIFAKVDSSLAHLYGYHFVNLITPHLTGSEEQKEYYYRVTAEHNYFWGNAFNPVDITLKMHKDGDKYILNGTKTFCSGSVDSDCLLVSALFETEEVPFLAIIPTNRIGITINNDWDNFGQRQTDSGSLYFDEVLVEEKEILKKGFNHSEFSKIRINISSFILNHLYLGIAEGALEAAVNYTKTHTRARSPLFAKAIDDPIIQHQYGQLFAQLEAAKLLVEKSDIIFQNIWDTGEAVSGEERLELDKATNIAKVITIKAGLDITSRIFDVMGSRATSNRYGFDRFWRNLRTMSLHVPVDTTTQELGRSVLYDD